MCACGTLLRVLRHVNGVLSLDLEHEMQRLPEQTVDVEKEWDLLQVPLPRDAPIVPVTPPPTLPLRSCLSGRNTPLAERKSVRFLLPRYQKDHQS